MKTIAFECMATMGKHCFDECHVLRNLYRNFYYNNSYIICIQVQSSFNDYDIACKLVRFLRLSARPGSYINCHSRMERVLTLHSNR